ncbi:MAG: hypothetical protein NPIRA02_14840 [Nitrospirales bacterium]|nr:MAG: hypothetical protein NPIRA02_14840 [Nitrospirales bacterium]
MGIMVLDMQEAQLEDSRLEVLDYTILTNRDSTQAWGESRNLAKKFCGVNFAAARQ